MSNATEEKTEPCTQVRVDCALCAKQIKTDISDLLHRALSGKDETLRYDEQHYIYIRWGLVERKMHEAVDAALGGA